MIDRLAQVSIAVRDLPRAIVFYRDVVGLKHLFDAGTMSFFDCGGVRVLVGVGELAPHHAGSMLYFNTDDIGAEVGRLREHGATIELEPMRIAQLADRDVWMARFLDPDENTIALMSEVKHA